MKGDIEWTLSALDAQNYEILEELKNMEYNGLEDKVFRLEVTYTRIMNVLVMKNMDASTTAYTLTPGV